MRPIQRAAVTGLFALWLAPLTAVADRPPADRAEARGALFGPEVPADREETARTEATRRD